MLATVRSFVVKHFKFIANFFNRKRLIDISLLAEEDIEDIVILIRHYPEFYKVKMLGDELIVRILQNVDNEIGKKGTGELIKLLCDGALSTEKIFLLNKLPESLVYKTINEDDGKIQAFILTGKILGRPAAKRIDLWFRGNRAYEQIATSLR